MHHNNHHHSFVESSSDILFFSTNHTPAEGVGAAAYAFHLFSLILDVFFYSLLAAIVISIVAVRVVQCVKWVWAPRPANPPTNLASSVSLV